MTDPRPLVTIIVTTYNRAALVGNAVRSILAQTYPAIDCLVVDDGSTDETAAVLKGFDDPRVRVIRHERNRGSEAAKNTGLENIRGEWFTFVDSDDEIVPEAIETLLRVPETVDPAVNKVECNAVDADTGEISGRGLDHDQYLDLRTVMSGKLQGDFWGITRSDLLRGDRFHERLTGYQSVLWNKVRRRAKEYYIHCGLLKVHRQGADRMSTALWNVPRTAVIYQNLLAQHDWLEDLAEFRAAEYPGFCLRALLYCLAVGDRASARGYHALLRRAHAGARYGLPASVTLLGGPPLARAGIALLRKAKDARARRSTTPAARTR